MIKYSNKKNLTYKEKKIISNIINNSWHNFLTKQEKNLIVNFLSNILKNQSFIKFETNFSILNLINKLSLKNTLNKADKQVINFCLFLENKQEVRQEQSIKVYLANLFNSSINKHLLIKYACIFSFIFAFLELLKV